MRGPDEALNQDISKILCSPIAIEPFQVMAGLDIPITVGVLSTPPILLGSAMAV